MQKLTNNIHVRNELFLMNSYMLQASISGVETHFHQIHAKRPSIATRRTFKQNAAESFFSEVDLMFLRFLPYFSSKEYDPKSITKPAYDNNAPFSRFVFT